MTPLQAPAGWDLTVRSGRAADLHTIDVPQDGRREVWVLDPILPALVLGSTQPAEDADAGLLAERGIDLVRRRSGGGAVLLVPGRTLWVDVIVPRGDPLWDDDVTRSFGWFGRAWQRALRDVGIDTEVHGSTPEPTPWSSVVCFAGIGAGEVLAARGGKVVGLSQRRTRAGARIQSVAYLGTTTPDEVVDLLATPAGGRERAELRTWLGERAGALAASADGVLRALVRALPPA